MTKTLALRGLEEPFFYLCCMLCLAGCAVVSVFGSGDYDRKKKLQSSIWRVVLLCQFLVLAGNLQFCYCGG